MVVWSPSFTHAAFAVLFVYLTSRLDIRQPLPSHACDGVAAKLAALERNTDRIEGIVNSRRRDTAGCCGALANANRIIKILETHRATGIHDCFPDSSDIVCGTTGLLVELLSTFSVWLDGDNGSHGAAARRQNLQRARARARAMQGRSRLAASQAWGTAI